MIPKWIIDLLKFLKEQSLEFFMAVLFVSFIILIFPIFPPSVKIIAIINFRKKYINYIVAIFLIALVYTLTCCLKIGNKKIKEKKNFIIHDGVKWKYTEQSKDNRYIEGRPYCIKDNHQLVFVGENLDNNTYIYECPKCKKKIEVIDYAKIYYDADIIMRKKKKLPGLGYEIKSI